MKPSSARGAICLKTSVVSEAWKAVRTCNRGKSIRNRPLVMLWSDAYGRSMDVLVFWLFWPHGRKYPTGSVRCTYGYHTGPCGWRTGLETPITSVVRAIRSPQAACMRPVRARARPIGFNRSCTPRKEHTRSPQGYPVSFKDILHYVYCSFGLVRSDKITHVIPRKSRISKPEWKGWLYFFFSHLLRLSFFFLYILLYPLFSSPFLRGDALTWLQCCRMGRWLGFKTQKQTNKWTEEQSNLKVVRQTSCSFWGVF